MEIRMKHRRKVVFTLGLSLFTLALILQPVYSSHADDGWIVVNTEDDSDDGVCDSNHCSLREAINQANFTPGKQGIRFNIPNTGPFATIEVCGPLPDISDRVIIDGTLPPGSNGPPRVVIRPDKSRECPEQPPAYGFWIVSEGVTIRGLSMVDFKNFQAPVSGAIIVDSGTNNLIENNLLGLLPTGAVQGNYNAIFIQDDHNTVRDNVISGNWYGVQVRATDTRIQGNFIGTDISGTVTNLSLGNQSGIVLTLWSEGNIVGGVNPSQMNIISGNSIGVEINSPNNTIIGNRIGTDRSGTVALGNSNGILITGPNNIIGGAQPGEGNLISGNNQGLGLGSAADDTLVFGNTIGADVSRTQPLGNWKGINIGGSHNIIGGLNPGEGNLIAYNLYQGINIWVSFVDPAMDNRIRGNTIIHNETGVLIPVDSERNSLTQNSIYDNIGLGIDLEPLGVSPNDPGDTDVGGNTVLNFPEFSVGMNGTLGTACASCTVEVFSSDDDPSGYGEGMTFIDSTVADSNGDFTIPLTLPVAHCSRFTATATDPQGNTSEFSENVEYGICLSFNPWELFGPLLLLGFSIAIGALAGRSPGIHGRTALAVAGVVGIGLAGGLFVILRSPAESPVAQPAAVDPWAGLPSCSDYIEPDSLSPAEETIFGLEDDPELSWSPLADMLPDSVRWTVELSRHPDPAQSEKTSEEHLAFSTFNLQPEPGEIYKWRLSGETGGSADGGWRPFCAPTNWLPFQFERLIVPAEPSDTPEPSPTPTQTPTPTPDVCVYTAIQNANCRSSDHSESEQINILMQGESAALLALNPEYTHGQFELGQESCWIWLGLLDGPENPFGTCNVPIIDPIPACTPELDEETCILAGGHMSETRTTVPFCVCPE
jgi:CSLREA domain-containing protein